MTPGLLGWRGDRGPNAFLQSARWQTGRHRRPGKSCRGPWRAVPRGRWQAESRPPRWTVGGGRGRARPAGSRLRRGFAGRPRPEVAVGRTAPVGGGRRRPAGLSPEMKATSCPVSRCPLARAGRAGGVAARGKPLRAPSAGRRHLGARRRPGRDAEEPGSQRFRRGRPRPRQGC